jgi:phage tail-like protein
MADTKKDPVSSNLFFIDFGSRGNGYFSSVSGGGTEVSVIEHVETTEKGGVIYRATPGNKKFTALELQRGITADFALWDWFQLVIDGKIEEARTGGSLVALDSEGKSEVARWNLVDAWCSKLTFPKLDAKSNELAMEGMTIQHRGMIRVKV